MGDGHRMRQWAQDQLEEIELEELSADHPRAEVAQAALDFLREQPTGDGTAFRVWVGTADPFDRDDRHDHDDTGHDSDEDRGRVGNRVWSGSDTDETSQHPVEGEAHLGNPSQDPGHEHRPHRAAARCQRCGNHWSGDVGTHRSQG